MCKLAEREHARSFVVGLPVRIKKSAANTVTAAAVVTKILANALM